ncbi:beta-fructofuranosidase, insoluble isoenzyme 7-like [Phragmites australis]|uniref:beta-fructofuranosidase, insoluble isoenzyme 7-like n=1 Tax=Phragmites australis TaxID=29695 RepID=UPI002D796CE2|nr:beta-fructofuranosidase, insoluble isoenzyme 7-like [Phragmites australis]
MAGFPLAACAAVAFHLCLLAASSSTLRLTPSSEGRHGARTAYHFQPAKNWQNDPNGPMYYNGIYHFFYQYNPHGALWDIGNLSWGHSVSGDLVNWAALDNALDPTVPFDANGCWSGSATILPGGTPAILYTGIDAKKEQVQNLAFPKNTSDPLLREWDKPSYNPVIPLPVDVPGDKFRDPSTAWLGRDGLWRIALSAEVSGVASTLIYRSADFLRWERNAVPLHSSRAAGMVECPDLFPVKEHGNDGLDTSANGPGVRHVLKLSVMDTLQDYYMIGRYNDATDAFVPEEPERGDDVRNWRRLDYGHVYASKSFFDARKNRRVLWAWANESDSQADDIARGWSGVQTFPRKVWMDKDGKTLRQWPIEEIETLRTKRVGLQRTEVNAGALKEIVGVAGSQADVKVVFKIPSLAEAETLDPNWLLDPQKLCGEKGASVQGGIGPFGLIVMASGDLQEHTAVFFRVFKHHEKYKVLMCTDLTRSSTRAGVYKPPYGGFVDIDIEEHRSIKLRTLVDHSVVESFGAGGRACITARVYPEHAATSNSHLFVFNNGTDALRVSKLEVWELATATVNIVGDSLIVS